MYLIELILKKITNKKAPPTFDPLDYENASRDEVSYETCEHIFMPVDSTNELLACTKCGIIVKRRELKNKNFFKR